MFSSIKSITTQIPPVQPNKERENLVGTRSILKGSQPALTPLRNLTRTVHFENTQSFEPESKEINWSEIYKIFQEELSKYKNDLDSIIKDHITVEEELNKYAKENNLEEEIDFSEYINFEKCDKLDKEFYKLTFSTLANNIYNIRCNFYQLHQLAIDKPPIHLMLGINSPPLPSQEIYEKFLEEWINTHDFLMFEMEITSRLDIKDSQNYQFHIKNIDAIQKYIDNLANSFYAKYGEKPTTIELREDFIKNTLQFNEHTKDLEKIQEAKDKLTSLPQNIRFVASSAFKFLEKMEAPIKDNNKKSSDISKDKGTLRIIKMHLYPLLKSFTIEDQKKEILNFSNKMLA